MTCTTCYLKARQQEKVNIPLPYLVHPIYILLCGRVSFASRNACFRRIHLMSINNKIVKLK